MSERINKLLIANRGEIACRVARTARRMGIRTVAVYSDADVDALHVAACDEAYRLGPAPPRESYLDGAHILAIARGCGAQAIHPGYGFLSENEVFAAECAAAGIVFVGPPPQAIAAMGSKSAAKRLMATAGVPLVPGYHDEDQDHGLLGREAARIGFPVLIKPTAGGGGKGMKVATSAAEFPVALASAQREAKASFGDDRVLVERYLATPRHIEIQVFADTHGSVVYLFERDCSVQRRHQKVLEEAPAPGMTAERRRAMGETAVAAARTIGYVGAGTVEFIADQDGTFYFMEMNTRLQVEHPVTEMITGVDLVEWQLRVARGEPLPKHQSELSIHGHALEARIYAEDPERDFLPSIGRIAQWQMPAESARVRIDTGFRAGDEVSPYYDPMLAKLIVHADDRASALALMNAALAQCAVTGVATNLGLLERVVEHPAFARGDVDTGLIARHADQLLAPAAMTQGTLVAAALAEYVALVDSRTSTLTADGDPHSPWCAVDGWRLGSSSHRITYTFFGSANSGADATAQAQTLALTPRPDGSVRVDVMGHSLTVRVTRDIASGSLAIDDGTSLRRVKVLAAGAMRQVISEGERVKLTLLDPYAAADETEEDGGHLHAPMSGTIVAVPVQPGDRVKKGAPLVVLEAMKMEHTITAPADGVVAAVHCAVGERVAEGVDLVAFTRAA
jgi:3-methylcrotonyl-CoA carboxylase alpha subunit